MGFSRFSAAHRQLRPDDRPEQIAAGHLGRARRATAHVQQIVDRPSGIQRNPIEQRRDRREPRRSGHTRHSGVQGIHARVFAKLLSIRRNQCGRWP